MQRVVILCPWINPVLLPHSPFQYITREGASLNWTMPSDSVDICMTCGYTDYLGIPLRVTSGNYEPRRE